MQTTKQHFLVAVWAGILAVILFTGCQSFNGPPPGHLVSITITNRSLADISQATRAVFAIHGFEGSQTSANKFTYERAGTRANNLAYGNEMFNEAVTIRVVVTVTPLDATSAVVACNAWLVESDDDSVFEDSHKARELRKWPYEKLLNDIKGQLGE